MSSISEFYEKDRGEDYYNRLIEEIGGLNGKLNAFNAIGSISEGFPFSVKDNICVKGIETTASSKMLGSYVPPFNATVVERMLKKGFGFLGKTNMDEFGFGSFGLNCAKPARNPFNEKYVAGGSSSGAAVATSILKYHVAIAESTGGSISTPAAFCGVVGFTPTYGTISRYGLIDYANSLDKIGIMARSGDDAREVFDVVRGSDGNDATCTDPDYHDRNTGNIFVIDELTNGASEEVMREFSRLLDSLAGKGYRIERKSLKILEKAVASYYVIATAEASTNLAKYTGFKYGLKNDKFYQKYNDFFSDARENFGIEAKRRIAIGTFVRGASVKDRYYVKALKVRRLIINELAGILKDGFILNPVMPIKTPSIEEAESLDPLTSYKADMFTIPPNLCGFPHVSFTYAYPDGMPIGAQLTAGHFDDYALLGFLKEWESGFKYRFRYDIGAL